MPGTLKYPYRKAVDIPAWVLQFIVCLVLIGLSATLLATLHTVEVDINNDFSDYNEYHDKSRYNNEQGGTKRSYDGVDNLDTAVKTAAGVAIGICSLTIVFDIVEIVLIARKRMPPALYLSSACVKSAIWIAVFIVEIIPQAIAGIILSLIVVVTSLVQMGFGANIVHKNRKGAYSGGKYEPALNPADPTPQQQGSPSPYGVPPQSQPYGAPAPQVYGVQQQQPYGVPTQQLYGAQPVYNPYTPQQQQQQHDQITHGYTYGSHVQQTFPSPVHQQPSPLQPTPSPQPGQQQVYAASPTPQYGYAPHHS